MTVDRVLSRNRIDPNSILADDIRRLARAEAAEPAALDVGSISVEILAMAAIDGTDADTGDIWLHKEDANILRDLLARSLPSEPPRDPTVCDDPEHPDGAYCRNTTGLHTCYSRAEHEADEAGMPFIGGPPRDPEPGA